MPSQAQLDEVKAAARFVAYIAFGLGTAVGAVLLFILMMLF